MNRLFLLSLFTGICSSSTGQPLQDTVTLRTPALQLSWQLGKEGWKAGSLLWKQQQKWTSLPGVTGEYTLLFSPGKPDSTVTLFKNNQGNTFPEAAYKYPKGPWKEATGAVALNTAGTAIHFYPEQAERLADGTLVFTHHCAEASLRTNWKADPLYAGDLQVRMVLTASQTGYFSLPSPSLLVAGEQQFSWGMIPGVFQGRSLEKDFVKAYAYGQGIPDRPVIARERTTSTLSPLISLQNGITLAVIPEPGTGRDPWTGDRNTHKNWQLGLSLMNRKAGITPTVYHPVLGEQGSYLQVGDSVVFSFRYSLHNGDWYTAYQHAVYDIYRLRQSLVLKETQESLTDRVLAMRDYVCDDKTSKWVTSDYRGIQLGAQAYLGGVYGAKDDATKNADYGAMWMLASIMNDTVLRKTRLPYALNFKKVQQQQEPGFFQGAAIGQYYLLQSKRFTEEWGNYVEPVALTYYIMMDLGNILLFDPAQQELKEELRKGADRLLSWMSPAGEWVVAYDRASTQTLFKDIKDLRPTFYGLLIAYRLLGDQKYLTAARKGADWYIHNAVNKGHFLGVCGDGRFAADFATGQSAQALLDLYELTGDKYYQEAGIRTARLYTTSIYTHPIPSDVMKNVKGKSYADAAISQAGLSFEHGGIIGSANGEGPILLASHAGLFVRMFGITGDSIFIDMARAAAWGRDAFVDPATHVASYYWSAMNRGPGSFPHHAWWQIGWIMDYLVSEVKLRSGGAIHFPSGFITPKVGPHQPYGFAPGRLFGHTGTLVLRKGLVVTGNPAVDYITAADTSKRRLWIALLNNDDNVQTASLQIQLTAFSKTAEIKHLRLLDEKGIPRASGNTSMPMLLPIPAFGLRVIEVSY